MITILASAALNTIQDRGRLGCRRYGVGTSGAMDVLALDVGNALLGNAGDAAAIEVQTFPFRLRFEQAAAFAVTGADGEAVLDGRPLPPWWATTARAGQELTLSRPRSGARAYLCVAGGIAVPVVLGSRSTYLRTGFGGHEGRALQAGDVLPLPPSPHATFPEIGAVPPAEALPAPEAAAPEEADGALVIRAIRAGEHELFPAEAQALFWSTAWKISAQSDRGGYRLSGPKLLLPSPVEMRSYGVVPGIVQLPAGGEPIIQLSDANTAGGYPKMAGVIEADLWRLGQTGPGGRIRFREVSHAEAVAAMRPVRGYLASVRRLAALRHAFGTGPAGKTQEFAT